MKNQIFALLAIAFILPSSQVQAETLSEKDFTKVLENFVKSTVPAEEKKGTKPTEFSTEDCEKPDDSKLIGALLAGNTLTHKYKFAKGCDIEGSIPFQREAFKIDLKTRNLGSIDRVLSQAQYELTPRLDGMVEVEVNLTAGKAYAKAAVLGEFSATYSLVFSLLGELMENNGGVIKVSNLQNKKVKIKYPFKADLVVHK